jgi:hypothetical protein
MKRTYVYVDGEFVERKKDSKGRYHYVMPDIVPYKSMIDGRMVTSRSEHRRHLKANNCIEIGNEDPTRHVKQERPVYTRLERIKHMVNARMTNDQADRLLRELRQNANFTNPHRRG